MATLTRCIDLIHSDTAPYVYSLRQLSSKAGESPLDPKLVQFFAMEYHNFKKLLAIFQKQEFQMQRFALETVRNEVEQLHSQLIAIGNERPAIKREIDITNGNLLWYIQKMMELRVSASAWQKKEELK